jgi:hypothetical protein
MSENQHSRFSNVFTARAFNRERGNAMTEMFARGFPYSKLNQLDSMVAALHILIDICSSLGACTRINLASMHSRSPLATAGFSQAGEMVSCCDFSHDAYVIGLPDGMQTAISTSGISIKNTSMIRVGRSKALM